MKKSITVIALFFLSIGNAVAQKEFQGMAVYESKTSSADMSKRLEGNKDITPDMRKMIEQRMKNMLEKTFILNFDRSASIYKEEEKLDATGSGGNMRMMSNMWGGGGTYYKNVKEKVYSVDKEFMGKEFLIKDTLPKLEWKMESETRQIGGYTCYKATAVKPVDASDFRNMRPKDEAKNDEKKEEGKEEKKTANN